MNDLSSEARAILDAGRDLDNPGSAARERARRAVLARIAAASAVAAMPATAAAVGVPLAKIVLPAVLVMAAGGVGGGLWWGSTHATAPPRAAAVAPRPVTATAAPPPTAAAAPPAVEPIAPTAAPARPPRHKGARAKVALDSRMLPAAAPPADSLQDETALLARVNAALRSGDTGRGLSLLDEYDRRFPNGALHEETMATRIIARCQSKDDGAGSAARRFIEGHPRSPLSSRVRSSCLMIEPGW